MKRRSVLVASLAMASLMSFAPVQAANALPEGPVNFIIPVAVGGGTDLTFRALSEADWANGLAEAGVDAEWDEFGIAGTTVDPVSKEVVR